MLPLALGVAARPFIVLELTSKDSSSCGLAALTSPPRTIGCADLEAIPDIGNSCLELWACLLSILQEVDTILCLKWKKLTRM